MRKIAVVLFTIVTMTLSSISVYATSSGEVVDSVGNGSNVSQQKEAEVVQEAPDTPNDEDLLLTDSMTTDSMTTDSMTTDSMTTDSMTTMSVSNYGLIPNDVNKKNINAKLLNRALNAYGSITLEGTFYIGNTSETVTNPNIEIIGSSNTELIFNGRSTPLFNSNKTKNLTISNIKFTNLAVGNPLLIAYDKSANATKINRVKIEGCIFEGDISVYRLNGDVSLNPETASFGIDEFIFTNNSVSNTTYSFIVLKDVPFRNVEISNNTIKNFQIVFANIGLTNGSAYETQLVSARQFVHVYNNTVTSDDNWWAKEGSGSYYTFVLTENQEVVYDSNHVEGLKSDSDIALYDAYLSSVNVTYTNNTWINNIVFDENKINNTLLKSKECGVGGDAGTTPLTRLYANNTFIVEESFADKMGKPKSELFVYFMDLTSYCENYTIENNKIDVYDLRFPVSSKQINNFTFKFNEIKAKYALGGLAIIRLTDAYQSIIEIANNNIQIEQTGAHPSGQTNGFQLVRMVDTRTNTANSLAKSITIEDNIIHGPFNYVIYGALADAINVTNNQFNVASTQFKNFGYGGNHPELRSTIVSKY